MSDTVILVITISAIASALGLMLWYSHKLKSRKMKTLTFLMVLGAIIFVLVGVTFALFTQDPPIATDRILLVDAIILLMASILSVLVLGFQNIGSNPTRMTTRKMAFFGIIVGFSSVLMMLGIPIIPGMDFLKLEISGLIVFLTLLWFGWKSNLIHVIMPTASIPVIPVLDESINFLATMMFILPTALFLHRKQSEKSPSPWAILALSLFGVIFTTVGMTLYNAYINLPLVYHMTMPFSVVIQTFGWFNLLKWGAVALSINLFWRRLYAIRNYQSPEIED